MVNVVTHCRVSSEEQAQKDISIPAQRKLLNRWVEERPDHRVVAEFVDEGQSAYAPADKRPGFIAMVSHCRKHRIDAILVHKLDRFSRNREESILFKSLLRKHGVAIRSITENFDPETPQGFLYEGMIEVINQFYSMNLATETIKGMRENAERGHVNGGRIPFGYRVEKVTDKYGREHGVLAFSNEQDVAVVREIFDLATTGGMGCKAIANALNARGAAAPRGRHWSGATIDHILNNRVYVGDSVWFKSRKQGRSGRQRTAQEERIVVPDAHPAIIDRDTFDRRKALAAERRFDVHTSPGHKVHYLLSRLIVCDVCGNHFGGRRLLQKEKDGSTTERFAYYCGGYLNKGTSVCASLPIPKHWLEGVVLKLLRARLCEPEALAELEEKVRKRIDGIRREYGSDSRVLDQKLADLERRIQNYYAAIGDGLDPAVCRAKIAELTAKKEELEREVALVQREDFLRKALERNLAEVRRFSAVFEDQFESLPFERKRQVVLHFVEKIEVVERRLIRITFQVPFDNTGLKHLVDDIVTPGADTPETETVKMPTIPDGSDSRNGGVRGAIPRADLTGRHRS
jgi:site-specific DNA recombinase